MKPAIALFAAFALGASVATAVALVVGHVAAVKERAAREQRDMQTAAMMRIAENALRSPQFLPRQAGGKSEPDSLADVPAISAPVPLPAMSPASSASKSAAPAVMGNTNQRVVLTAAMPAAKPILPAQAAASGVRVEQIPPKIAATAPSPVPAPQVDLAKIIASVPVEGVSYEKASVSRLERSAVHLQDGKRIAVGENFPSGETLLAVDADNSRVVTSRRQILLFGPPSQAAR